ncbi:MAG: hypothetical protein A2W93_01190 [Bacteroidetes bacterium GWF2_43_63]|nr:MAG: hypothetical protein A2W94_10880 [Bacteroidetes bacterium GWE2_42_42]OFY55693.1 MAG: hypothetical protein A2W93_01190 [Bacteroidetes bacterium GWF2_43_63]HBG69500.1 hypothetical protein [Bacteroidales bacterium]HCB61333.1 hypothetical protein [Bacteroidales bacterium]HCY24208.1 hypothetical protein [Bacteroidales bacterium]
MKLMFQFVIVLSLIYGFNPQKVVAQNNVGINPTGALPDPSAALDIVAADKGLLIPRMNAAQRLAIASPANGLLVYDTDSMCVLVYRSGTMSWFSLCSGGSGGNGHNTLTGTAIEPAGVNCTYGGARLDFGVDLNDNGVLDAAEILPSLTQYVCDGSPGATGAQGPAGSGLNTVALTTNEPAGANCQYGGVMLQFGLDANSNGILDAGEINPALSRYICNGSPGTSGALGCTNANYVLKNDGTQIVCSQIFDNGTNVGIGTATPTQKLDVPGNVKFSGALMPNNNPGVTGQVLVSQGSNTAPVWQSIGNVIQVLKATSTRTLISSTTFASIGGLTLSFTLSTSATVLVSTYGSLETTSASYYGSGVIVQVFLNGVAVNDMFQTIDVTDPSGFTNTIAPWSMTNTIVLTPGNHTINVRAKKYAFDNFYAGGNTTAPNPNEGALILTIIPQ